MAKRVTSGVARTQPRKPTAKTSRYAFGFGIGSDGPHRPGARFSRGTAEARGQLRDGSGRGAMAWADGLSVGRWPRPARGRPAATSRRRWSSAGWRPDPAGWRSGSSRREGREPLAGRSGWDREPGDGARWGIKGASSVMASSGVGNPCSPQYQPRPPFGQGEKAPPVARNSDFVSRRVTGVGDPPQPRAGTAGSVSDPARSPLPIAPPRRDRGRGVPPKPSARPRGVQEQTRIRPSGPLRARRPR